MTGNLRLLADTLARAAKDNRAALLTGLPAGFPTVADGGAALPAGWTFYNIDGAMCRDGSPARICWSAAPAHPPLPNSPRSAGRHSSFLIRTRPTITKPSMPRLLRQPAAVEWSPRPIFDPTRLPPSLPVCSPTERR